MSVFLQKEYWCYQLTILIHLITTLQALALPLNDCSKSLNPRNTTDHKSFHICAPKTPDINLPSKPTSPHQSSSLSFPPSPFLYRILSTPYIVKFTNYGSPIPPSTALALLGTAQEEILYEMSLLPHHSDVQMTTVRTWAEGNARLVIRPTPSMWHFACGLVLVGMMRCGEVHGFVEADLEFISVEDVFRPFGNGSLVLDW